MASDNHAHYARIGFIVIVGVIAIAATLIYMGGFHDPNSEFIIETYSDTPVNGLSVGSPVNLFGIKVGEVREITPTLVTYADEGAGTNDAGRVSIVMACNKKTFTDDDIEDGEMREFLEGRVQKGLRAAVTSNGITGLSRIDLKMVPNEALPEPTDWKPRYTLIPPTPSLMDNFAVAATKLMNKLKTMDLDTAWSNVQRMADSAARLAENADAMLESERESVRKIVSDFSDAADSFKTLAETLRQNPSLLIRASDPEPLPETAR